MKYFAMMFATLSLASAAMASDRNYVPPKTPAVEHAVSQNVRANVQQGDGYADSHVHFVHHGK